MHAPLLGLSRNYRKTYLQSPSYGETKIFIWINHSPFFALSFLPIVAALMKMQTQTKCWRRNIFCGIKTRKLSHDVHLSPSPYRAIFYFANRTAGGVLIGQMAHFVGRPLSGASTRTGPPPLLFRSTRLRLAPSHRCRSGMYDALSHARR